MTGKAPTICDGPNCGKTKGEGNRWLTGALTHAVSFAISTQPVIAIGPSSLELSTSDPAAVVSKLDWCSEACLHAYVSRFVTELRGKGQGVEI